MISSFVRALVSAFPATTSSRNCAWYVIMELKITPSGQTIVKPTALGPVANTDTKLLIYGLFQKGRVLAQDGFIRLLRFAPCKSMHPVPDGERVQGQTHSVAKQ